jgi:hypothetical protein
VLDQGCRPRFSSCPSLPRAEWRFSGRRLGFAPCSPLLERPWRRLSVSIMLSISSIHGGSPGCVRMHSRSALTRYFVQGDAWRRSRVAQAEVCKTFHAGSIPAAASISFESRARGTLPGHHTSEFTSFRTKVGRPVAIRADRHTRRSTRTPARSHATARKPGLACGAGPEHARCARATSTIQDGGPPTTVMSQRSSRRSTNGSRRCWASTRATSPLATASIATSASPKRSPVVP